MEYDQVDFLESKQATRFVNLQPYSIFTFEGRLKLTPSIDTWKDTNRKPDLVIRDNSLFDAMANMTQEITNSGIGTVWGDWETADTIVEETETNIAQRNNRNRAEVDAQIDLLTAQGWDGTSVTPQGRQRVEEGETAAIATLAAGLLLLLPSVRPLLASAWHPNHLQTETKETVGTLSGPSHRCVPVTIHAFAPCILPGISSEDQ